jgi:hypothetical protein
LKQAIQKITGMPVAIYERKPNVPVAQPL